MKTKWPESVPVLTARDIYKGDREAPDGKPRHCLIGWATKVFGRHGSPLGHVGEVDNKVYVAISSKIPGVYQASSGNHLSTIVGFNDDFDERRSKIARVWNEAMRDLGYTEVEEVKTDPTTPRKTEKV